MNILKCCLPATHSSCFVQFGLALGNAAAKYIIARVVFEQKAQLALFQEFEGIS